MDLNSIKAMTEYLNESLKTQKVKTPNNFQNSKAKEKSGVVIAKKGEAGYIDAFDLDEDGEITLEEFNEYCESNGIEGKEKVRIMLMMQSAKINSKLAQKASENKKGEEKEKSEINEGAVYARKGDDKYNEVMDKNKNGVVTYKEYMEYCNKKAQKDEQDNKNKAVETYSQNEKILEEDEEKISVEAEA